MRSGRSSRTAARASPSFSSDLKAAFKRFQSDQMTDHAAALTYYSLMSLFPALLFGVALLGVFGQETLIPDTADYLKTAGAPAETVDAVTSALDSAQSQQSTAITALVLGLALSLNSASGAFGAVGRALNQAWRVDEGRGFVRRKANDLLWTLIVLVLVLVTFVLALPRRRARRRTCSAGSGSATPRRTSGGSCAGRRRSSRRCSSTRSSTTRRRTSRCGASSGSPRAPSSACSTWIVASALFFVYVSNFSSYSATYGAFAAAVILLVWLWLTNVVLLFGAELNAAIDVRRSPELPRGYEGPPLPAKEPAESS